MNITAYHVISTAPFFARGGINYKMDDFDLLTMALSALSWRKNGGKIALLTDKHGKAYIDSMGIADLWDEVLPILSDDMDGINADMFWAAGKLLALREVKSPCVLIDTDFIAWDMPKLEDKIVAAHFEEIYEDIYPKKSYFLTENYIFPQWDWDVLPANTAFLYLPDEAFKQYYVSQSIGFMKSAEVVDDYLCYMVFAEQRLLSMCAKQLGEEIVPLMDFEQLFSESYTHIWGAKQAMRERLQERARFCQRCKERLLLDFSEYQAAFSPIIS